MNVSIDHPTDRPNFTAVTVGPITIWFSYRTAIAFHTYADGHVISENIWSATTGRHLNYINDDKSVRVSNEEFNDLLETRLATLTTG